MIPYFFIYVAIALLLASIVFDVFKLYTKSYSAVFKVFFVLLSLIAAFRYGVGPDTPNYMYAYACTPEIQNLTLRDFSLFRFQPLYVLTSALAKSVSSDFLVLQIMESLVFFGGLWVALGAINMRKIYLLLFILISGVYFDNALSAMRQGFAVGFFLFSVPFLIKRKWVKFYIMSLVAFNYHTGASLIFLLPIFFFLKKISLRYIIIFISALMVGVLVLPYLLPMLASGGDGSIVRYNVLSGSLGMNFLNILRNFIQIIVLSYLMIKRKNECFAPFFYLSLLYIALDIMAGGVSPIMYRLCSFLFVFYMYTFYVAFRKNKEFLVAAFLVLLFFWQPMMRFIPLVSLRDSSYKNYCFYFSTEKDFYKSKIHHARASDYLLL